jgi:serine protease inhibitor
MKKYRFPFLFTFILLLLPNAGCEKKVIEDPPGDPVLIELSLSEKSLARSSNQFSFDIFNLIVESDSEKENIMISPLSISYALSMTLNGAAGETREAMMEALRYNDITLEEINNSYLSLSEKITKIDKRVIMNIANSVWVEDRLDVKEAFIDALIEYFNAENRQFDINDPGIVDEINTWISDNTFGLIKNMVDDVPGDVVMLLVNAIYFNGKWRYQFDESDTKAEDFYLSNGSEVDVDMMHIESSYKQMANEDLIIAELPYGQGNFVMDIILPADGKTSSDILPLLTNSNWESWMNMLIESDVDLYMPRFKYEYKIELKDVLSAMGMGLAFSGAADFSNIADQGLAISKVLHQTFIENKEDGTEAAAATVVMIELTSLPSGPMIIRLDRPFFYIIRETSTDTIVFMGLTGNPAA